MKETGLTGKRRSTTIAASPDDGKSQSRGKEEEEDKPTEPKVVLDQPFTRPTLQLYRVSKPMHAHRHNDGISNAKSKNQFLTFMLKSF